MHNIMEPRRIHRLYIIIANFVYMYYSFKGIKDVDLRFGSELSSVSSDESWGGLHKE